MENTTTLYVNESNSERSGPAGSASAKATEMPPRKPPQVRICQAPFGNRKSRFKATSGAATVMSRATKVIAMVPAAAIYFFNVKATT